MDDPGISWHVDTHQHRERTPDWYWGLGLLAVVGAGFSVFFGNVLFAIIITIGAASVATLVLRGPREHLVRIDPRGLSLDGTMYRWKGVRSFWVDERKLHLLVTTEGILHPQLVIPLVERSRANNVRSYLKRFAHEEEQEPHLGEHIAEIFGL